VKAIRSISLQSKLLAAMLALVLTAIALVAWLGYTSARDSLRVAAFNQVQSLQRAKAGAVVASLESTRNEVLAFSAFPLVAQSATELLQAYRALGAEAVGDAARAEVAAFYDREFTPTVDGRLGLQSPPGAYLPRSAAGWLLQQRYIARGARPYTGNADLAGTDDSAYGRTVARVRPSLGEVVRRLGFDNILLTDPETLEVFFSYKASTVLGTSLQDGPYAASNLASAVRALRNSQNVDDYKLSDFEFYRPSLGAPRAFISTPVFDGNRLVAILSLRLPLESLEKALFGTRDGKPGGIGRTDETYLVGPDLTMRSDSRFVREDAKAFVAALRTSPLSSRTVGEVERLGTTVLTVPVKHDGTRAALRGESGVLETEDYRGEPVFAAYGPVDLDSLRWGLVSEIDRSEALQPLTDYARRALAITAALALAASLFALWLASRLARPIEDLAQGARRISAGDLDTPVPLAAAPEFRALGVAFNDMAASLRDGRARMQQQTQETERLLASLLPAPGAAQLREGRHDEPQSYSDVTVAFVNLVGVDAAQGAEGEGALHLLSDIVTALDEAAEEHGVEKVRTIGSSYLAASGLSVERPDHTARMVDFAREVVRIVGRFNAERGLAIVAEIGINAGPVTGGLVGRRRFIYDLWGDTVHLARGIESDGETSIQVTRAVYDRVRDEVAFGAPFQAEVRGMDSIELYPVIDAPVSGGSGAVSSGAGGSGGDGAAGGPSGTRG
jgi:class 3 adenylate cyclase